MFFFLSRKGLYEKKILTDLPPPTLAETSAKSAFFLKYSLNNT